MSIPLKTLNRLRYGKSIAAELPLSEVDRRAYVMVIPQVPNSRERPDLWTHTDYTGTIPGPTQTLRDPAAISGYEVRYLEHAAKYTTRNWTWDDLVFDDVTTRVRRFYIDREDEIEAMTVHGCPT